MSVVEKRRFLKEESKNVWVEISAKKARVKIQQCLRDNIGRLSNPSGKRVPRLETETSAGSYTEGATEAQYTSITKKEQSPDAYDPLPLFYNESETWLSLDVVDFIQDILL